MRHFRIEPLEERTLLSFTAAIVQATGASPFSAPAQKDPTNGANISFEVTFGDVVTNFSKTAILTTGTTLSSNVFTVNDPVRVGGDATLGSKTWIVPIAMTPGVNTYDATIQVSIKANAVSNAANTDGNFASTSTDDKVRYDNTSPTVTIEQATSQVDPASTLPIHYTATFSEKVTGFEKADVTVTAGTVTSVTPVGTDGRVYDVVVGNVTADATIRATIGAGVATDDAGNTNLASTSVDNEVGFNIPLTVAVNQMPLPPDGTQADPTRAVPVYFQAKFSEPINPTTFTEADITVDGTAPGLAVVAGSIKPLDDNLYSFKVTATGDGTMTASIAANSVQDASGENNAASTSTDNSVTYDRTWPTVTVERATDQADPTTALPIHFTVTFSEKVTGFDETDVTLTAGVVTSVTSTDDQTYDVSVGGVAPHAVVTATIAVSVATDEAGNPNIASTGTNNQVAYNPPLAVTLDRANNQAELTNTPSILFTATFSEAIDPASFTVADVTLDGTSTATVTGIASADSGANKVFTITVTPTTDGTVTAEIAAGAVLTVDQVANEEASATTDGAPNTVTYDGTKPTVTINQAADQDDPTAELPITFTVTFSEPVRENDFTAADVDVKQRIGGSSEWTTVEGITVLAFGTDDTQYTVTVPKGKVELNTTIRATVKAGAVTDDAGNLSEASTSNDNLVRYGLPLTVTLDRAEGQTMLTNSSLIAFIATFSEAINPTTFKASDVTLTGTSSAAVLTDPEATDASNKVFKITVKANSDGTVTPSIAAGKVNVAQELRGNEKSTTPNNKAITVTRDGTAPTVTINQASTQSDPVDGTEPIEFTVNFSEPVRDGDAADNTTVRMTTTDPNGDKVKFSAEDFGAITLSRASGNTIDLTQCIVTKTMVDADTYTISIAGISEAAPQQSGTLTLSIETESGIMDAAWNVCMKSTGADNSVTFLYSNDTIGLYDPSYSAFYLRNMNGTGNADESFVYGAAKKGLKTIIGDWDGDGKDTIGLYDPVASVFYLKNDNSGGYADITFAYGPGNSGWIPLAGNWDGVGSDTIGFYNPVASVFYLRNSNDSGYADLTFQYGPANGSCLSVVGDWDGDGTDTVGLYNRSGSAFYLRNDNSGGYADLAFAYGPAGNSSWKPVAGDWNGNNTDTIGLFNPHSSTFFLKNTNQGGGADSTFTFGPAGPQSVPIVGDWNGPPEKPQTPGDNVPSQDTLTQFKNEAIARWAAEGLSDAYVSFLQTVPVVAANLPGTTLGKTVTETEKNTVNYVIEIDWDAAGSGWYVDGTPSTDDEFAAVVSSSLLEATSGPAVDHIDLLSVVEHELGHALGLSDLDSSIDSLMRENLNVGMRQVPTAADVDWVMSLSGA